MKLDFSSHMQTFGISLKLALLRVLKIDWILGTSWALPYTFGNLF